MKTDKGYLFKAVPVVLVTVLALTGCAADNGAPSPASASEGYVVRSADAYVPRTDDGIDVVYFEVAEPCDCMAEVGDAVELAIDNHFSGQIQDGSLRFYIVVSDDANTQPLLEMLNAQPFDLMIVTYEDGQGVVQPIYEIWNLMGDNEAIEEYVRAAVEASLSGQA